APNVVRRRMTRDALPSGSRLIEKWLVARVSLSAILFGPMERTGGAEETAIEFGTNCPSEWRNWQTHQLEGLAVAIPCRFKSCLRHHCSKRPRKWAFSRTAQTDATK